MCLKILVHRALLFNRLLPVKTVTRPLGLCNCCAVIGSGRLKGLKVVVAQTAAS